jgi:hypothetical protein
MLCEQTVQKMGEAISAQAATRHERETDASTAVPARQAGPAMSRAEIESKLLELERRIEQSKTVTWLAERERDELRFELRRVIHAEAAAAAP